jgi:hypothetical protein
MAYKLSIGIKRDLKKAEYLLRKSIDSGRKDVDTIWLHYIQTLR